MIKVHNGQLRSLKPSRYTLFVWIYLSDTDCGPCSGHYRPPATNFRAFSHALQNQGVDMSRVSMGKSYAELMGIEGYSKTRRKVRGLQDALQKDGEG
jgi:hypothetical protein